MSVIKNDLQMQLLDFDTTKRRDWMERRKPFSALFELTSQCNMNCIHCYLQNNHTANILPFQKIIEIIDILYENGILFLTFTGGEIFTRQDFADIYLYAKTKGFLVELFTNGYLLTDSLIEMFVKYPPLLVDISLYGASETTYRKMTGIENAFERVLQNCSKLKAAGIRVALKTPIIKETITDLPQMQEIAKNLDVPFVYTFEISSTIDKSNKPKDMAVSLAVALRYEFENHYEQIRNKMRSAIENPAVAIEELRQSPYIYSCNVARNSFVIDYYGRICPCMKLRHKGVAFQKENFSQIWQDFAVYSEKKASSSYVCKNCEALYYCDVCPAEMDFLYGDAEYRPNFVCRCAKIRKKFYEKIVSFDEALQQASYNEI